MLSTILIFTLSLFPGMSISSELIVLLASERSFKSDALLFQLDVFANDVTWGLFYDALMDLILDY